MSFRDVKIKIPDRKLGPGDVNDVTHRKRGLRFEKKQLVEFLPPNERVKIQSWARPDDFVCYGRRTLVGLRADDVIVSIERLCLSLSSCRITFNSKVIKSFVPELRSRYVFRVFRIPHVHFRRMSIWVCDTSDM